MHVPAIYVEERPNGSVRAGFRIGGRKVQRTMDYRHEAETWAEEARDRAMAATRLGLDPYAAAVGPTAASTGTPPAAEISPRFDAYAERWIEARRGSIADGTWKGYRIHLDAILRDTGDLDRKAFRSVRLDEIAKGDVEAWRTRDRAKGATESTSNARLKVVRMILNYAVDEGRIVRDPSARIPLFRTDTARKHALTVEEERRLLAACDDDERLLVLLALDAGLRSGEAFAVTTDTVWTDEDGTRYLDVVTQVDRHRPGATKPTKGRRRRDVPITARLDREIKRASLAATPGGFLVTREDGETPWTYDYLRHCHWRGLTSRSGLKARGGRRRGFHELRHTYATRLAAAGVAVVEISALLGHADVKTTETYLHAGSHKRRAELVRTALVEAV